MEDRQMQISTIPLTDIEVNAEFNCRGDFAPIDIVDLAKSIQEKGLMQPVMVRKIEGPIPYSLVAGFRRYKAHQAIGKDTISCIVQELDERSARVLNLVENLQREDLTMVQPHLLLRSTFLVL